MDFTEVSALYDTKQLTEALTMLQDLHRKWHDKPREHVLIHYWQIRIAIRQQYYQRATWEVVAMLFAAPTSLVQRYLGLVRKNIC